MEPYVHGQCCLLERKGHPMDNRNLKTVIVVLLMAAFFLYIVC